MDCDKLIKLGETLVKQVLEGSNYISWYRTGVDAIKDVAMVSDY